MRKKIICLLIFCFGFMSNVNADFCKYNINGTDYTLYYEVDYNKTTWTTSYSFGGSAKSIQLKYTNGNSSGTGLTVEKPTGNNLFGKFYVFGSINQPGACPVLVSTGTNTYTLMPIDVYNDFFAPSNTLYCEDCTEDLIYAKDKNGFGSKYTFNDVCRYLNDDRMENYRGHEFQYPHSVPLLGYFYYNSNYSNIVTACKNYKKSYTGLPDGVTLRQMFSRYENDFIIGEVEVSTDSQDICPLNDGNNKISDIMSCLIQKGDTIDDSIEKFRDVCTENEMRAIQSYASGNIAAFYTKGNVSSYLDNEIKMLFKSFSSECGAAADDLYSNINNLNRILYSYSTQDEITSKLAYMYAQSKYLIGYGMLANLNADLKIVKDECQLISDELRNIIKEVLNALRIGAVVIVIFLSIIEVYKAVVAMDGSAKQKMPSLLSKRIIYLIIILLLPSLVLLFLDLLNDYVDVNTSDCVINDLKT